MPVSNISGINKPELFQRSGIILDMANAARAIIIEDKKMLLMHRNKNGKMYFTLVGGKIQENETAEQGLAREVKEETGLDIASCRLVYVEEHNEPYNHQYIFLCTIAPHGAVAIQDASEEALLNRVSTNLHTPLWADVASFGKLPFLTMNLQSAIIKGLKKGFPGKPIKL
jgi:ADP-ribose pyrophosphatase YjhB (NUDIX family)